MMMKLSRKSSKLARCRLRIWLSFRSARKKRLPPKRSEVHFRVESSTSNFPRTQRNPLINQQKHRTSINCAKTNEQKVKALAVDLRQRPSKVNNRRDETERRRGTRTSSSLILNLPVSHIRRPPNILK